LSSKFPPRLIGLGAPRSRATLGMGLRLRSNELCSCLTSCSVADTRGGCRAAGSSISSPGAVPSTRNSEPTPAPYGPDRPRDPARAIDPSGRVSQHHPRWRREPVVELPGSSRSSVTPLLCSSRAADANRGAGSVRPRAGSAAGVRSNFPEPEAVAASRQPISADRTSPRPHFLRSPCVRASAEGFRGVAPRSAWRPRMPPPGARSSHLCRRSCASGGGIDPVGWYVVRGTGSLREQNGDVGAEIAASAPEWSSSSRWRDHTVRFPPTCS